MGCLRAVSVVVGLLFCGCSDDASPADARVDLPVADLAPPGGDSVSGCPEPAHVPDAIYGGSPGTVRFTAQVVAPENACAAQALPWGYFTVVEVQGVVADCQNGAGVVAVGVTVAVAYDTGLGLAPGAAVEIACSVNGACVEPPDGGGVAGVDATCAMWVSGCYSRCFGAAITSL